MFPDIINVLICEYVDNEDYCLYFLTTFNEPVEKYEFIFIKYYGLQIKYLDKKLISKIRKLRNVRDISIFTKYNFKQLQSLSITFRDGEIKNIGLLKSLQNLHITNKVMEEIKENILPDTLQTLYISYYLDKEIKKNVLPQSLKILGLGSFDYKIGENTLPQSLQILYFDDDFNEEINTNILPSSLQVLYFRRAFNKKIKKNVLPKTLLILNLGSSYAKPINPNILPKLLKILYINDCKWWHVTNENDIPPSLEIYHTKSPYAFLIKREINYYQEDKNLSHPNKFTYFSDEYFFKDLIKAVCEGQVAIFENINILTQ